MTTYLVMVDPEELESLRADPAGLPAIVKPDEERFTTRMAAMLSLFLTGSPYPEGADPLAVALLGGEAVRSSSTADAVFGAVPVTMVPAVAKALRRADRTKIRAAVRRADLESLAEDGVGGAAELAEALEPAEDVLDALESLTEFYEAAAGRRAAVISFTM